MSDTYRAEQVDPILKDMFRQVRSALEVAEAAEKRAAAVETQLAEERRKVADLQNQVVLQKVAAVRLDPQIVDQTLETLEDLAILKPDVREKVAAELVADPNNALRLLSRVVTFSADAPQSGSGVPKKASVRTNTDDPDGWSGVIRNGA